jgi:Uma2 family endonuclease
MFNMATGVPVRKIEYPSSDGKPMAETWLHVRAIMLLHQALEDFFRNRPDAFIASDQFWYWEEGNTSACIAPDVMVVLGVPPRDPRERSSFFSWEENGAIPSIVFEMASKNTGREDVNEKYDRYESLGVREYFLFDPEALYLKPQLQGYRLNGTAYRRLHVGALESELGFGLRAEDTMIRLIDLRTKQPIPTRAEAVELIQKEAEAAQKEAIAAQQRATSLQSEFERLKALIEKHGHLNGNST